MVTKTSRKVKDKSNVFGEAIKKTGFFYTTKCKVDPEHIDISRLTDSNSDSCLVRLVSKIFIETVSRKQRNDVVN